jgi:hypothetical protein
MGTAITSLSEFIRVVEETSKGGSLPRFDELGKIVVDYGANALGLAPPSEGIAACRAKSFLYRNHEVAFQSADREQQKKQEIRKP